jgi:hypothetical protein
MLYPDSPPTQSEKIWNVLSIGVGNVNLKKKNITSQHYKFHQILKMYFFEHAIVV